ncbi:hypothetical protein V7S43_014411 [Phytophthora oleae]|uniref:Uncharacterized protein n=1 Tax=Phytophthora oleae TaxID=2107226 RepID=A0ABD3F2D1_9STRA
MAGGAYEALSLAQVEEELRSAEAYLTASQAPPPPPAAVPYQNDGEIGSSTAIDWLTRNGSELEHDDSNFRRKLKTRPVLSVGFVFIFCLISCLRVNVKANPWQEERRREILAKLSSERQAVLHGRNAGAITTTGDVSDESAYRTPEERHQLIQKLLCERNVEITSESTAVHDVFLEGSPVSPIGVDRENELSGEFQHEAPSAESDDDIYYASDILDTQPSADIQPRSRLDFIFEGEEAQQLSDTVHPSEAFPTETDMGFSVLLPNSNTGVDEPVPPSLFAKLLDHEQKANMPASEKLKQSSFDENHHFADTVWGTTDGNVEDLPVYSENAAHVDRSQSSTKKPSTRIDFLAQPRSQTFAEREKQRVLLEMEQLRECTFRPNVQKPPRSISKPKNLVEGNRPGVTEFQWLTLSPRQKIFRQTDNSNENYQENGGQDVIQRLHLDGISRYDSRERARVALEVQKLEECTFKPKINPTSKSMFSMVDYKPIQHRVSDLQRAKAEYIERIREQLDIEECGPLSFTPMINPKSREIAANKLAEREADQYTVGKSKSYQVTDRLAEDADAIAERRLATQEYVDMLNEQPFAPKISEISRKIVEQKPEFQMDFVARQEYFQSRDQEKMETLEGFCDMDYARGEKLTFKPDIGNAEGVLKHLRPDRCTESSQQKLYRLTYNDQREVELKKHRLREEQFGKYTFKPEINPVSKALGRSSTLDELSHPVIGLQHDPSESKRSPPQERKNPDDSSTSRVALRQYFANKRFRSRVALEMEEASKAECTFHPNLNTSKPRNGSASTNKIYNREPRSRKKLEWQSENLLHLIEAERQKKAEDIEAKRNAQELKELEECTFQPNLLKPSRRGKLSSKGSPSPPHDNGAEEKPVIVRGLGRFLELKDLARKQQAEQKQREQKVFAPNSSYEPRSYTVPKPFKLSETSKDSIRRRLKVREEMRAKEHQECTFKPQTVSSQSRRVLQNMLNN